jgi:hypothetical protein
LVAFFTEKKFPFAPKSLSLQHEIICAL